MKLEKGLLSSTIRFEAPALVGSKRLGMTDGIISGEKDQEGVIEAISKRKAEDLVEVIRSGIYQQEYNSNEIQPPLPPHQSSNPTPSVADELAKLAKLKEQGVITDEEFAELKIDALDGRK